MATCPVCQSAIEITAQHHGTLYTCPRCSAVFFVGWDGQPEVAEAEPEGDAGSFASDPQPNSGSYHTGQNLDSPYQSDSNSAFDGGLPAENSGEPFQNSLDGDSPRNSLHSQGTFDSPADTFQQSSESGAHSYSSQDGATVVEPDAEPYDFAGTPNFAAPAEPQNPFADISEFGNSDTTQAAFSYTVFISGVDSAAVRAALLEALTDKKFGWEPGPLLAQMKDGALTIRSVSAVKASILIQRIKYLPVHVSWRQDVLSNSV